jgi:peptidoglycan/xylan/chitin deacetylase (PgdA/CDA1 family)
MPAVSLLFHDVYVRAADESGFVSAAADRYKLSIEEFDSQMAGLAQVDDDADYLITFDDGGVSYYTVAAERLEALGRRGHCFVSTDYIGRPGFLDSAQLRALHARGHVIGSHSASHPSRFSTLTHEQMRREWSQSRQVLEDLLGAEVTAASVPGGYYSRKVAETAAEAGIRTLFNSEPTRLRHVVASARQAETPAADIEIVGRYTIRHGDRPDTSKLLVSPAPWTRGAAWASWNAKGLVKPILGPAYMRVADWMLAGRATR